MGMRVKHLGMKVRLGAAALVLGAGGMGAWASYEYEGVPPVWTLEDTEFNPGGSAGLLLPSNDTRVNLYLLLADRRGAPLQVVKPDPKEVPTVLFPWWVMAAQIDPKRGDSGPEINGASRCQSDSSGSAQFIEAVRASRGMPSSDKLRLIAARQYIDVPVEANLALETGVTECGTREFNWLVLAKLGLIPSPGTKGIVSPGGKEFTTYLFGAQAFYVGRYDQAARQFASLTSATEPWVRETATYMVARTWLNRAMDKSFDDYGSLAEPKKRDLQSIGAAGAAFEAYLRAYPTGRYANSASGLLRRVHWLAGDEHALSADYARLLSKTPPRPGQAPDFALIQEIDQKLLPLQDGQQNIIRDPILLAVTDLQRMRKLRWFELEQRFSNDAEFWKFAREDSFPYVDQATAEKNVRAECCGPAITRADIEAQRPLFGNDTELYDYLLAAQAFFVRHQPREVLRLIPATTAQKRFSYVQFSRQMLRGFALQAIHDPSARNFWRSLFPGATQPYQHGAVELALAIQEEKSGRLDLVFAPGSPVQHPVIRQLLLEEVAGPALLRRQASRPGVPKIERDDALYTLLFKDLSRGFYRNFVRDVRLLPAETDFVPDASDVEDKGFVAGGNYDAEIHTIRLDNSLDIFRSDDPIGKFGCPTLITTVTALARNPHAIRPRLCLAEYFRDNYLDSTRSSSDGDEPPDSGNAVSVKGLASSRPQFPTGTPYSRLEIYKSVIRDPAATPDDKALALNRAVWCYGPSGNNDCGGIEVPVAQRRAWFVRLKTRYARSRWAKELKYYW